MITYELEGRVALITGANNPQGIGAATAIAFAEQRANVVLVYKKLPRPYDPAKTNKNGTDRYLQANAGNADAVEARLKEMNAGYLIIESDITSEEHVQEIYNQAIARFGKVDILVNNAADCDLDGLDTIEKITPQVIDETFAVNVKGTILMTREMINRRGNYGRIINLSSTSVRGNPGQCNYAATKAALTGFTATLAKESGRKNITVNCVAPGPTETEMYSKVPDEIKQAMIAGCPMNRLGQPREIGEVIAFLASERASFLSGQWIAVNGAK